MFFFYFRYKLYSNLQTMPCELLVFSLFTRHLFFLSSCYFSFSRISSALIPLASNFLSTASASSFLASSAALASAFVFFASKEASSFSAFFSFLQRYLLRFQSVLLLFNRFLDVCDFGS